MPGIFMTPKTCIEGSPINSKNELLGLIGDDESSIRVALLSSMIFNHSEPKCKFNGRLRMVPLPEFIDYYKSWINGGQSNNTSNL